MEHIQKIYIVEDNYKMLDVLNESLSMNGFKVYVNYGISIEIDNILEFNPDLLLIDWMLPNYDGLEIIKLIKSNALTNNIPCILMTGRDTEADKITGYKSGVDAYLTKPFSINMLLALIKNIEFKQIAKIGTFSFIEKLIINSENEKFIRQFVQTIERDYKDPEFKLDSICQKCNVTLPILISRIKTITGFTPHQILVKFRMERAKELMRYSDKYISEISLEIGYRNHSVFSKIFKDHCGISPKAYMQKIKNLHSTN
jgi:YesN/AraC family two-component response regulator